MHPRKILSERAQRRFEIKAFAQINVKMFKSAAGGTCRAAAHARTHFK